MITCFLCLQYEHDTEYKEQVTLVEDLGRVYELFLSLNGDTRLSVPFAGDSELMENMSQASL